MLLTALDACSLQVLDLGQVVAGNFCGAVLSQFGADVIKVRLASSRMKLRPQPRRTHNPAMFPC